MLPFFAFQHFLLNDFIGYDRNWNTLKDNPIEFFLGHILSYNLLVRFVAICLEAQHTSIRFHYDLVLIGFRNVDQLEFEDTRKQLIQEGSLLLSHLLPLPLFLCLSYVLIVHFL